MYTAGPNFFQIVNDLLNNVIPGIKQIRGFINFTKKSIKWGFVDRYKQKLNEIFERAQNDQESLYKQAKDSAQGKDRIIDSEFWEKVKNPFLEFFCISTLLLLGDNWFLYHTNNRERINFKKVSDKRRK